jgi:thermostable 8-oxoguanine DNA glycosylase
MQLVHGFVAGRLETLELPSAKSEIWSGLRWGEAATAFTPAFWASQVWLSDFSERATYNHGETLEEEVAACLLGGHGFKSEVGHAAFQALRTQGKLLPGTPASRIEAILREPLQIGNRMVRYRFPAQKAKFLSAFLCRSERDAPPPESEGAVATREWLRGFPGIGYKTAAWIVRNRWLSDDVAIIDIHIYRAGILAGVFEPGQSTERNYLDLERKFVDFARAIRVSTAALDITMWEKMREFQDFPIKVLRGRSAKRTSRSTSTRYTRLRSAG